ncbi:hypothetical protein A0O32_2302 [Anoxybacillus flavithermus]|uniref:Uncharacterized protein n=1 Tax=Anoxybacillus flavithermus TaxID=33934 RepID=A0A178TG40_9BACL|nr:hypothetical protein A0O32_2302 [Anoxybacillus flavithermus]OAO80279.1 hypothetical protein TAF16_1186 [Anoxybacillus flavithermus]
MFVHLTGGHLLLMYVYALENLFVFGHFIFFFLLCLMKKMIYNREI